MFSGHRTHGVLTLEVFRTSQQLAIQSAFYNQPFHIDHKVSQIASVFVLRQALEEKFFRLVGVEIYDRDGNSPRLRHMFHYDFILANPSYFDFKAVTFRDLRKVYEWCNDVVHRVYHPLAWEINYAHKICRGLFVPLKAEQNARWSINNSVEINNRDEMQSNFIRYFVDYYDHGIWAVEPVEPEAMCI
jgi:hypothetical protein